MTSLLALGATLSLLIGLAALEYRSHQRAVDRIPHRIHVNGTRGKSSVTRLIGAGLRAGGLRTLTKVTGTFPRLILPDGSDVPIFRKAAATILEQLDIVQFAAENKTEVLVIECMALDPQFQRVTEEQMVRATLSVLTNVRMDHTDVMGPDLTSIGRSMANTIPKGRVVFTAENDHPQLVEALAGERGAESVLISGQDVGPEDMEGFSYIEHRENVGLALAVCSELGVERGTALRGMWQAIPDPGVLTRSTVRRDGKRSTLFNAFAANDPDSSWRIWRMLRSGDHLPGERFVLLNNRPDRKDRAEQLTELIASRLAGDADRILVMGKPTGAVVRSLRSQGVAESQILDLGHAQPEAVLTAVLDATREVSSVFAIGNTGGAGAATVDLFVREAGRG
ncbi:MAG: poly-gamma-glutamate synthase PgsB [Acidobacteriota bacterium]